MTGGQISPFAKAIHRVVHFLPVPDPWRTDDGKFLYSLAKLRYREANEWCHAKAQEFVDVDYVMERLHAYLIFYFNTQPTYIMEVLNGTWPFSGLCALGQRLQTMSPIYQKIGPRDQEAKDIMYRLTLKESRFRIAPKGIPHILSSGATLIELD